jgi:ABC-2 type transport system permease protein
MVVLPFGWRDLMRVIRSGEVISDLSKPCDFYWYWFCRELGRDGYYLLFRCIPTYIIGTLLFGLVLPGGWQDLPLFGITFLFAAMLGIAYRYLYNVVAFWIVEARAVGTLAETVGLFFAGSFVPLPFFPAWLHQLTTFLPFYGLMNLPAEMLLGKITGPALWLAPAGQIAWLVILTWCARRLTQRAVRRVISQGG